MTMSNTNTNVRSIRDQFQQPHQANLTKTRQEQKHDIVFPCSHCGRHQTISLLLQSNETRDLVESAPVRLLTENYVVAQPLRTVEATPVRVTTKTYEPPQPLRSVETPPVRVTTKNYEPPQPWRSVETPPVRVLTKSYELPSPSRSVETTPVRVLTKNYESPQPVRNIEPVQIRKASTTVRRVSSVSEESDGLASPLQRSNYALDFRRSSHDRTLQKSALEQNVKGLVDGCVRSSIQQLSYLDRDKDVPEIVEVDVEYDPVLGNIRSTRKRSSTMITNLDRDYSTVGNRYSSVQSRFQPIHLDSDLDKPPIWARRRTSQSTVRPSDLVREIDKKEKLEPTALRRLSRADLVNEEVRPNSATQSTVSHQNPALIKDTILRWCQELTQFYKGVQIRNFSSSWSNGLAFCAVIHRYFPEEFNFDTLSANEPRQNLDLAFNVALNLAGVEPLIDTDDMIYMGSKPDSKVIFTYVQSLYRHLSRRQPPAMMRERW